MKKITCIILAVLMLMSVLATTAFAAGHGSRHAQAHRQNCIVNRACQRNDYNCDNADENGDNACDPCKNQCGNCNMTTDENNDGFCDNCGNGSNYLDDDGNGICDHRDACANRKNTGNTMGHHGKKHGNHHE